jgi:hypothetical protein
MRNIDPRREGRRGTLRLIGVLLMLAGGILTISKMVSFFMSFGSHEPLGRFRCAFVGLPIGFVGLVLASYGFMGAIARYSASEMVPVGTDTFNYVADGTKKSVQTVAAAVGEGLRSLGASSGAAVRCPPCNHVNAADAEFCDACGHALAGTGAGPACDEFNDPDGRFCDHCGLEIHAG